VHNGRIDGTFCEITMKRYYVPRQSKKVTLWQGHDIDPGVCHAVEIDLSIADVAIELAQAIDVIESHLCACARKRHRLCRPVADKRVGQHRESQDVTRLPPPPQVAQ
jgi:hypothetical protein